MKREGPPQLQFLIATNLSQFRDEDAKRSVRSQAMIHWRHEDKKKRRGSVKNDLAPGSDYVWNKHTRTRQSQATQSASRSLETGPGQSQHKFWQMAPQPVALSLRSSSSLGTDSSSWQLAATETANYIPYYHENPQANPEKAVTGYEESEKHEERQLRALVAGLATSFGSSHDPFKVLPQFEDSNLDSWDLSRNCRSNN